MALTPDFDSYPVEATLVAVQVEPAWVAVSWSDGRVDRFHHVWLRDNCPCAECVHQGTKEQLFEVITVPADVHAFSAAVGADGALLVVWSADAEHGDTHVSEFHPGWLRRHAYDGPRAEPLPRRITWDAATLAEPPTFDGARILGGDDDELYDWLLALHTYGVSRVRDVPAEPDALATLVARIGIVRETNFGVVWDVRSEPDPITNANTALPLPPHVDLPTREYQPGLQFLHCLVNDAVGGDNILIDGFRVGEVLRATDPEAFRLLSTVPFQWANRSESSDYRFASPLFVLDADGELSEVRVGNWLRAPLAVPFDLVESCYRAYRALFELTYRIDLQLRFRLEPGEVMAFDNRRALHARGEFSDRAGDGRSGRRLLRGCYSERDEMYSRLRMIERARRVSGVAG